MRHVSSISILALATVVAAVAFTGCLKNDIPYPRIQPNIVELTVEDQSRAAMIDSASRTAVVYLDEAADIYAVKVISSEITPGATFVGDSLGGTLDLSSPKYFTLKLYQEYTWSVRAEQTIERNFSVAGQIGQSVIDVPGRRVLVTMPETADLSHVELTSIKLGSVNSVLDPALKPGDYIDLSHPLPIDVIDYDRKAQWVVYTELTEASVTTVRVDAWTNVAWVYGEAQEGRKNTVQYRRADSLEWITVPDEWLTSEGGAFHARLIHLESLTDYVARAVSGDEYGLDIKFTTGLNLQPENADFENWWLDGKVWCPWAEGGEPYWGTGNKGATTLGSSNTFPTDDTPSKTGRAAQLETRFVGIGIIGKLAAGNIFAGSYVRTDGTNGVLSFGRQMAQRPTRMRGYWKYTTAPISSTTAGFEDLKGQPDTCIVWCALIDTPEPFEIRTNPNNRQLFDPDAAYVVAYGKIESGSNIPNWSDFEFTLDYKATDRVPRWILITASASKYGDYFTGGNGAVLCVDDFELLYDY